MGAAFLSLAACVQPRELSPTRKMAELLREPPRWQNYTAAERFTVYNNALRFYGAAGYQLGVLEESGAKNSPTIFQPQLQRLDDIFLSFINTYPKDPYNSYYLYNIVGHYIARGEQAMGLWLLRSMYQRFPDLKLPQYPSIHYLILDTLGRMEPNVDYRIEVIQKILRYYDQDSMLLRSGDMAENYRAVWLYRLGQAYETKATEMLYKNPALAQQQLRAAMDVYGKFFNATPVSVPEEHNARNIVANKINIYNAKRKWYTDSSLEKLVNRVKYAIRSNNVGAVLYYQANGFFVLSADYRDETIRSGLDIYLPNFMGGTVRFGGLTAESNEQEAWLYSTNWPFHLRTWYLYFQKIHYSAAPDIDGNWQWAGIYLGDFY